MLPQVFKERELRLYCTLRENDPKYQEVREKGKRLGKLIREEGQRYMICVQVGHCNGKIYVRTQ